MSCILLVNKLGPVQLYVNELLEETIKSISPLLYPEQVILSIIKLTLKGSAGGMVIDSLKTHPETSVIVKL